MIDWLAQYSGYFVLLTFFVAFVSVAVWIYRPANKVRIEKHGDIPFREAE